MYGSRGGKIGLKISSKLFKVIGTFEEGNLVGPKYTGQSTQDSVFQLTVFSVSSEYWNLE